MAAATPPLPDALAARVAAQLAAYSAQGIHRTGTAVDWASAAWLQGELERAGVPGPCIRQRTFPLQRLDAGPAYLHVEGSCTLGGLGMFDCGSYTDLQGVAGSVGWAGSDAPIGVVLVDDASDASDSKKLNAARSAPGARAYTQEARPLLIVAQTSSLTDWPRLRLQTG
jgi:hypothetical protein